MKIDRKRAFIILLFGGGVLSTPFLAAMEPLADAEMAQVSGHDGLLVSLGDTTWTADRMTWRMDEGVLLGGNSLEASLLLDGISVSGLVPGTGFNAATSIDVGSDGTDAYVMISGSWNNLKATIDALRHSHAPTNSIGSFAVQSDGSMTISNTQGLFNAADDRGYFSLVSNGDLFYRQGAVGSPELSFGDLAFSARFTDGAGGAGYGRVGIDSQGLLLQSDYLDFDLNFDLFFAANPAVAFDQVNREPILLTGWAGGVRNATLRLSGGGVGYGSAPTPGGHPDYAAMVTQPASINPAWSDLNYFNVDGAVVPAEGRSQGLNLLAQWDYDTDFRWILGQAAGDRVRVDFFDWRRLGGGSSPATNDFRMPITLDALNAGQGPGGICFGGTLPSAGSLTRGSCDGTGGVANVGGQFFNTTPKDNNLAVMIRDARLHAYNTQVRVVDPGAPAPFDEEVFNWSLLYTFGKLDANIYFYPGGFSDYAAGTANVGTTGLSADVLLAVQSPGYWRAAQVNFDSSKDPGIDPAAASRWATNTHFMIADTAVEGDPSRSFGVGVLNADLIWQVENFKIELWDDATGLPGLALIAQNLGRYAFRGLLGAGSLDDLSDPVRVALIDINLETDTFVFVLSAPDYTGTGEQFVGFDAQFDFNGNAYFSMAEPSTPAAAFRIGDIGGRLMWVDGRVELISAQNTADARPKLEIENRLLAGSTAGGAALVGRVSFGGDSLGRMAIPSGDLYSRIALKKQ